MRKNNCGFMLLEIIIAIALISIAFISLLGVGFLSLKVSDSIKKETQADSLIKEEFEALRNFRDGTTWATTGLGVVNTGSANPYYLADNSNQWALVSGTETVGIFSRSIIFDKAYRNVSGDLSTSGTIDPDAIKVTIIVTWLDKTIQDVSYLTNWKNE